MSRERRCELLAAAAASHVVELADRCMRDQPDLLDIRSGPTVGTVALEVREPVLGERFIVGDVLVASAEVEWRGKRGWAMVLGRDRHAALACALCDAEVEAGGPLAGEVEALCAETELEMDEAARQEEAELFETVVRFEELA